MCLVVFGINLTPDLPFVLAANRDEFHARPARPMQWWSDQPHILGGRDLQAGGTWLAINRQGRFATVTNYRDAVPPNPSLRSRGHLVTDFLSSDMDPLTFLQSIDGERYAGFNLLVSDSKRVGYLSNRDGPAKLLDDGIFAVSNAVLDTPWHKVTSSKNHLTALHQEKRLNETELLRLLANEERAPAAEVESGQLGFEMAHTITAPFIRQPQYGTRCSTVVLRNGDGKVRVLERSFGASGQRNGDKTQSFQLADS